MLALHGVDIYVHSSAVPDAPAEVGALKRIFISDRGTRVQNVEKHDSSRTEIYCVRYESEAEISDSEVTGLLSAFAEMGLNWPKVQKLYKYENGDNAYSQPY
ncbi:MAG: hypothetical protein ABIV13_01745 [Fimbriimonadales bacterium]